MNWVEYKGSRDDKLGFRIYYLNSPMQILLLERWDWNDNKPSSNKICEKLYNRGFYCKKDDKDGIKFENECIERARKESWFADMLGNLNPIGPHRNSPSLKDFVETGINLHKTFKYEDNHWSKEVLDEDLYK